MYKRHLVTRCRRTNKAEVNSKYESTIKTVVSRNGGLPFELMQACVRVLECVNPIYSVNRQENIINEEYPCLS